jgi:DHA1 family multidrug resistance protein-like MFS transporter
MQTLKEVVRDAPFGQLLRLVTRNRVLKYPEELPGFVVPPAYFGKTGQGYTPNVHNNTPNVHNNTPNVHNNSPTAPAPTSDLEKLPSRTVEQSRNSISTVGDDVEVVRVPIIDRVHTLPFTQERLEADRHEADVALHGTKSEGRAMVPSKTADGVVLADWYTTDDPADPQNWSQGKKTWTAFLICLYSFIVYAGSSIYVSSMLLVMQRFGVGEFKASMGLALYVLGYGVGPLLFAPLSEGKLQQVFLPKASTDFL